jgi:PST family polysaccharide transporter
LQDDREQLARAYLNFCGYLSRIILPIVLCAAIAAPELIKTIYGPQWLPAAVPMQMLACGVALVGLRTAIGSVYYAKNHPEFDFYLHGVGLVLVVATVLGLASTGLVGVSFGRGAVEVVMSIAGLWLAGLLLDIGIKDFIASIRPGVGLALMCAPAVIAGKVAAGAWGTHGVATLLLIIVPPAVVYCWRESATAMRMFGGAFGVDESEATRIVVAQELQ